MDCARLDGGGEGQNLRVDRGDSGEGCQLILVFYKKPLQDQLTVRVCGLVVRGCGVLFVVRLDAKDGVDNEFGDGRSPCVHEDGGEEEEEGHDIFSVLADGSF